MLISTPEILIQINRISYLYQNNNLIIGLQSTLLIVTRMISSHVNKVISLSCLKILSDHLPSPSSSFFFSLEESYMIWCLSTSLTSLYHVMSYLYHSTISLSFLIFPWLIMLAFHCLNSHVYFLCICICFFFRLDTLIRDPLK